MTPDPTSGTRDFRPQTHLSGPQTQDPRPIFQDPRLQTPDPTSGTPDFRPQTRLRGPQTSDPRPDFGDPRPQTHLSGPQTSDPRPIFQDPRPQTPDPSFRTPDPRPQTHLSGPQTSDPRPQTRLRGPQTLAFCAAPFLGRFMTPDAGPPFFSRRGCRRDFRDKICLGAGGGTADDDGFLRGFHWFASQDVHSGDGARLAFHEEWGVFGERILGQRL